MILVIDSALGRRSLALVPDRPRIAPEAQHLYRVYDVAQLGPDVTLAELEWMWNAGRTLGIDDDQIFSGYAAPREALGPRPKSGRLLTSEPVLSAVQRNAIERAARDGEGEGA